MIKTITEKIRNILKDKCKVGFFEENRICDDNSILVVYVISFYNENGVISEYIVDKRLIDITPHPLSSLWVRDIINNLNRKGLIISKELI